MPESTDSIEADRFEGYDGHDDRTGKEATGMRFPLTEARGRDRPGCPGTARSCPPHQCASQAEGTAS
ncbi:hypothetical protein ADL12_19980 [Streptomyces regalis]|uniref:Uncharacterized protein n=1 Tax=Streptomyces regalis TaxID=68262 RepID=A0A0X3UUI3_9ACTN|nr:hypothetical protein ADL12_19980 [Streptomyces regalis]